MNQTDKIETIGLAGGQRAVLKPVKAWRQGAVASLLHRIRSPGLPRCFGISGLDDRPDFKDLPLVFLESPARDNQILIEYLEGVSLRDYPPDRLTPDRLFAWFNQILEALAWIMQTSGRPFVHSDISPENIIIGPRDQVSLIDFSDSLLMDEGKKTADLPLFGKKGYAAPEVYQGTISPLADLYSLAMSFLSVLAHQPASQLGSKSQEKLLKKLNHPLADLLAACLKEAPQARLEGVRGTPFAQLLEDLTRQSRRPGPLPDLLAEGSCPYLASDCPLLDLIRKLSV
ncbi:MAG TPA: protein kinase [Clostridia bacterium]|nr:protein kinase [Clostridia bacterium]